MTAYFVLSREKKEQLHLLRYQRAAACLLPSGYPGDCVTAGVGFGAGLGFIRVISLLAVCSVEPAEGCAKKGVTQVLSLSEARFVGDMLRTAKNCFYVAGKEAALHRRAKRRQAEAPKSPRRVR